MLTVTLLTQLSVLWFISNKQQLISVICIKIKHHENTHRNHIFYNYLDHFDVGFAFLQKFHGNGYAYEATVAVLAGLFTCGVTELNYTVDRQ